MNTNMSSERPGSTFKLPQPNLMLSSKHPQQSPMGMNKLCKSQGSTKFLQRSYDVESMDSDTDHIVASFNLEGIANNYNT